MQTLLTFTHIINQKLKNIYLYVDKEGTLIVKSPKVPMQKIESLILSKSKWINKTREKMLSKKGRVYIGSDGVTISYLGEEVSFEAVMANREKLVFEDQKIYYTKIENIEKLVDKLYLAKARDIIIPLVDKYSHAMQLYPTKISFRKSKRQWGSCNAKNEISFNTMLLKLPLSAIIYVVIHELAHIKHKNHQKEFWCEVERFSPTYKSIQKEIKSYSVI